MAAPGPLASTTSENSTACCAATHKGPSSDTNAIELGMAAGVPAPGRATGCPAAFDADGAAAREPVQAGATRVSVTNQRDKTDQRTDEARDMRGIKSRGLRPRQPAD